MAIKSKNNSSEPNGSSWNLLPIYNKLTQHPGTFFALTVGITYFYGFIIVNSYLFSYGVREFNLVKARYLSAGFLFIALCILESILVIPMIRKSWWKQNIIERLSDNTFILCWIVFLSIFSGLVLCKPKSIKILQWTHIYLFIGVVLTTIDYIVRKLSLQRFYKIIKAIELFILCLGLFLIFSIGKQSYKFFFIGYFSLLFLQVHAFEPEKEDSELSPSSRLLKESFSLLWFLVFTTLLAASYGKFIYRNIGPTYGGGKPIDIQLICRNIQIPLLDGMADIKNSEVTVIRARMLDETESNVRVILQTTDSTQSVVQLSRELVIGIIYDKSKIDSTKNQLKAERKNKNISK